MPTKALPDTPELWKPVDLAAYFHHEFSLKTFRNWRAAGVGPPFVRVGGRVFYIPESVRDWAKQQQGNGSRRSA